MKLADLTPDFDPRPFECCGKLAEWSGAANRLFASGCEAQGFALLASFAAPLMGLFRTDAGGAVVSIWGGRKSGKTIALTACETVWGLSDLTLSQLSGPERYVRLAAIGNLPALDETLANRDPEVVRVFLANFVRRTTEIPWHTILISFAPRPLGEIPGIELEAAVPASLQVAHAKGRDPLAYDLIANRGNAGVAYLRYLTHADKQRWARGALASQLAEMTEDCRGSFEHRYAMRAIAACHVAGLIAVSLGILEFDPDRITRWVKTKVFEPAAQEAAS